MTFNEFIGSNIGTIIISFSSAIIVALFNLYGDSKKHHRQQWWDQRLAEYRSCILLLTELEKYYKDWVLLIREGMVRPTDMQLNRIKDEHHMSVIDELRNSIGMSDFYFDKKTVRELSVLSDTMDEMFRTWGFTEPLDLVDETYKQIVICKNSMISNARRELI